MSSKSRVIMLVFGIFLLSAFVGTASATTWYVDDDGGADFTHIQDAINNASAGDTIFVKDGTYTENVDVNKRLTIRSENGAASTTVQALKSDDHVFELTTDYVNISGFTVSGAADFWSAGIYLGSDVAHCIISDNTATNNSFGIWLQSSSSNTLTGNIANSNNNLGIKLDYSSNNELANNTANSNNESGIYLSSSNTNTLTGNKANSNNGWWGIKLDDSSNNELTNNTANSNNYSGIKLYAANYNTLAGNIANSNNACGIYLGYSSNNELTGNTVSNNEYGIYLYSGWWSPSNNNLIYNNYFNNTNNAYDDGNNFWNITPTLGGNIIGGSWLGGNYWSDYDGIDTNDDGLGDTLLPYNSNGDILVGGDMHPLVPAGIAPLLSIEKSDNPDPALVGGTLNYSIIVNNIGYATATNVTVAETYDVNVTFLSAIPAPSEGNATWIIPTLIANETKGINISVTVNQSTPIGTVLHNIVNVTCDEGVMDSDTEDTIASLEYNCSCGDICVSTTGWWRDGEAFYPSDTPIQAAIDNASAGDTICVKDGEYNENVNVNKRLTIKSENGFASTTVQAAYHDNHVVEVTADYVNMSGFTVTGATSDLKAGIYLNDTDHCIISDNNALNNNKGTSLYFSCYNTLTNNNASNNGYGIDLYYLSNYNNVTGNIANSNTVHGISLDSSCNSNIIMNNIASNNKFICAIALFNSDSNTLKDNTATNNGCGICLSGSNNNLIYNNYFNNTNNACDYRNNVWNITKTAGPNIIGGSWLGGNYWGNYDGIDANGDGLGDNLLPYNSNGDISIGGDMHPLVPAGIAPLLSIEKSDNPNSVPPGGTLNYSIIVNNIGYATATNVTVTERYDENVTFVSAIPAPSKGNDTWIFPALNVNVTKWINISVTVNPSTPIGTVLHNIVNVTCAEGVTDFDTEDTIVSFEHNYCTCGDFCVTTTGWWRDGGAFNPSDRPIQDAIDNAISGDIICVKDGTYHENVDVTTANIVIKSENGAASTIVPALNSYEHVFEVSSDYVTISGFTVSEATGEWWDMAGIYLGNGVDHCNISDNNVSNNKNGIWLDSSSSTTLTNNTVSNNDWCGIYLSSYSNSNTLAGNTASYNDLGIWLDSSSNNTLKGNKANSNEYGIKLSYSSSNTLTNNTVSNNNLCGIYLSSYSSSNTLTGNKANSNKYGDGIELSHSSNTTLTGNTVNLNFYGIELSYSSNITLTGNTVNLNFHGIRLSSSKDNIIRNNIACNNSLGIELSSSSSNTLTRNTANLNKHPGIVLSSSSSNTLTNNTANSNNENGIRLYSSSNNNLIYNNYFNNTNNANDDGNNIWNITKTAGPNIIGGSWLGGNYWSDYAGEDRNGDGLGNTLLPYNASGKIATGGDWHPLTTVGYAPPEIISFAPPSPVNDTVCTWRTFNITVNQTVNVSWYLNNTFQHTNVSTKEASYMLHAEVEGEHNVSAIASNENGTDMQTWVWNVTKAPDLMITAKWLCWPDNCTICYNVTNIGNGTAPACHNTALYVDGVAVAYDHVPEDLAPGESYIGCFDEYTWRYTPPSDNITVCADNNETVDELDEDNNCLTNIWRCGDVNCDGKVTMSDVRKVFNRYLDPNYPLDLPWAADVNCDGKVTMSDVRKVFNRYLDPGYELNCCCIGQ